MQNKLVMERAKRRLRIVQEVLSEGDIEELYGAGQPTLNKIKDVAQSEIPGEVDNVI